MALYLLILSDNFFGGQDARGAGSFHAASGQMLVTNGSDTKIAQLKHLVTLIL